MKKNRSISLKHTKAQWPVSLEELKERRDQNGKDQGLHSGILLILFFSFIGGNIPLAEWIEDNHVATWVPTVSLVILFAIILAFLWYTIRIGVQCTRAYDLNCPSCGKALDANRLMPVAIATGHCGHCGERLVKDHPSLRLVVCEER